MPHDAYVLIPADGVTGIRSHAGGRPVLVEQGKAYCRVEWDVFEAPETWLRDTSRDLDTDVLWLLFQKQSDAFAFQRWTAGVLRRRLAYGVNDERIWESADGSPESWEADILFSTRVLERRLKVLKVLDMSAQDREAAVEDLKRLWSERRLEVGSTEPTVSAGSAGLAIIRHYEFPEAP